jgi:hypothetical protein
MPDIVFTLTGLAGAAIVLVAYFLLSAEKMRSDGYVYPLMNMFGSLGVLVSLTHQWNLASAIINSIWVMISLIAIARHYLKQRQS